MNFNGSSHKLSRAGSIAGMLKVNDFTMFAIIRPSTLGTDKHRFMSFGTAARGWSYGIQLTSGIQQVTLPGVTDNDGSSTTAALLNVWQLLACVTAPTGSPPAQTFYRVRLDTGALVTEAATVLGGITAPQTADTLNIGTWIDGNAEWFQGDITWVGYIPAALTQAGIELLAFMPRKFPGPYDMLAPLYDGGIDLFAGNGLTVSGATVGMTPMITYGAPLIWPLEASVAEATLSGTVVSAPPTEADIVAGGRTIVLSLTGASWIPN